MKFSRYISYITSLVLALIGMCAAAQELPEMPADPSVKSGVLPNGTNYYVMANADTKGLADFALVQKSGKTFSEGSSQQQKTEELLTSIPVLNGKSPRKFFSRNGVVPYNGRFIDFRDDASVFRFSEVITNEDPVMLDSTLLVLMGMLEAGRDYCAPSDNAVIVSGDIDADEVVGKLKLLSYMIPARESDEKGSYAWSNSDASYSVVKTEKGVSEISLSWRLERTPESLLGTIQPFVHEKLMGELGEVAKMRIRQTFVEKGIPFANIVYRHISSAKTSSDEKFQIKVLVSAQHELSAVMAMTDALSSLVEKEISIAERKRAGAWFLRRKMDLSKRSVRSDASNIDLCINAFLNNTQPVTEQWVYDFYRSKELNDTLETKYLNGLASAVLTLDKNIDIKLFTPSDFTADSLKQVIDSAWNSPSVSGPIELPVLVDTLRPHAVPHKLFLSFIWKEYLSGGSLWTFGNGIRVAYKRMETGGRMHWAMGLSGGYGSIRDLESGEGAFVADMLKLSKVSGMPWEGFVGQLAEKDIYLDVTVGLYNSVISGSSPSYELGELMRALSAIADERKFDSDAFQRYKRDEWLRLESSRGNSRSVIDSLMCPDYKYSKIKSSGKITDQLPVKANALFDDLFSKVNDGIIVLVGDMEESLVRKQLRELLFSFRTKKKAHFRPSVSYKTISGSMSHVVEGDKNAVYLAMSIPFPMTISNYALQEVATMVLRKKLTSALVGSGMYAKVYSDVRLAPSECFNVLLLLEEVPGASKEGADETARAIVKEVLSEDGLSAISDAQVNACKSWLKHHRTMRKQSPDYWVNAMLFRYLEGKDFTTDYDEKVDEITPDAVKELLLKLNASSKVEYIIRKK